MTSGDDDIQIRPGRIRHGNRGGKRPKSFVAEVMRAAKKAGYVGRTFTQGGSGKGRSTFGRGRRAALSLASRSPGRRVTLMARIVRHQGSKFRSASLARHLAYLKREGVTRDGEDARMFDARSDDADAKAFAERCEEDRHHFRFIVSPEDAADLENLRTFTRELMKDVEHDLGTRLEAMDRRVDHLVEQGLARRQGQRVLFAHDLLATLRRRELDDAAAKLSAETGLAYQSVTDGEHVSGVYRQRVTLASGRFAMIDDGLGFQLVPWRPALEKELGREVRGVMTPGGNVEWSFGRKLGLGL
jgi:hypothetical protein